MFTRTSISTQSHLGPASLPCHWPQGTFDLHPLFDFSIHIRREQTWDVSLQVIRESLPDAKR